MHVHTTLTWIISSEHISFNYPSATVYTCFSHQNFQLFKYHLNALIASTTLIALFPLFIQQLRKFLCCQNEKFRSVVSCHTERARFISDYTNFMFPVRIVCNAAIPIGVLILPFHMELYACVHKQNKQWLLLYIYTQTVWIKWICKRFMLAFGLS